MNTPGGGTRAVVLALGFLAPAAGCAATPHEVESAMFYARASGGDGIVAIERAEQGFLGGEHEAVRTFDARTGAVLGRITAGSSGHFRNCFVSGPARLFCDVIDVNLEVIDLETLTDAARARDLRQRDPLLAGVTFDGNSMWYDPASRSVVSATRDGRFVALDTTTFEARPYPGTEVRLPTFSPFLSDPFLARRDGQCPETTGLVRIDGGFLRLHEGTRATLTRSADCFDRNPTPIGPADGFHRGEFLLTSQYGSPIVLENPPSVLVAHTEAGANGNLEGVLSRVSTDGAVLWETHGIGDSPVIARRYGDQLVVVDEYAGASLAVADGRIAWRNKM